MDFTSNNNFQSLSLPKSLKIFNDDTKEIYTKKSSLAYHGIKIPRANFSVKNSAFMGYSSKHIGYASG